jgi:glycosyltransferase involved in cell wall biosynthesis
MEKPLDLSLVLACYNEEPIFLDSVEKITSTLSLSRLSYEIIFVDDQSTDKTQFLIRRVSQSSKKYEMIFHKQNRGRGKAISDGIKIAKGKVVGFIDIDLEVSPVYIPQMASMIISKKADMVIGKRIYRTSFSSLVRVLVSIGYHWLAKKMLDIGDLDTESGYKFFNRRKILPILQFTKHPHWFWDTEITVYARQSGLKIAEVPVLFIRRFDKKSSVKVLRDTVDYFVSLWKFKKRLSKIKK